MAYRLVAIHGAPRSGTSWLGKIFDSHPDVAYRFQPLFAYRFKGALNANSTPQEVRAFLDALYAVADDEFILQRPQVERGAHPELGEKKVPARVLVMKEVRYHYVIPALLRALPDARIVGLVRHPCGAINSWLKTPREFKPQWQVPLEWRDAPSKNQGRPEEYYGFSKWMELARMFLQLQRTHPAQFRLQRYEELVADSVAGARELFSFCGLDLPAPVERFLTLSRQSEVDDPDSVFRLPDVGDRWKTELSQDIQAEIERALRGTELDVFL